MSTNWPKHALYPELALNLLEILNFARNKNCGYAPKKASKTYFIHFLF